MKALLVIEFEDLCNKVSKIIKSHGFDSIHYNDPVKAFDNLEEIDPELIIISAEDYPRHWKIISQYIRSYKTKEECIIILLKGSHFPIDETAKIIPLAVNGVLSENIDAKDEALRLLEILDRYKTIPNINQSDIEQITPCKNQDTISTIETEQDDVHPIVNECEFMFTNDETHEIVIGTILKIDSTGLIFKPNYHDCLKGLHTEYLITRCSLKIKNKIFNLSCKIVSCDNSLKLQFINPNTELLLLFEK